MIGLTAEKARNAVLLDAHTHLDHFTDDELAAALSEIATHRVLSVAVSVDPDSYAHTLALAADNPLILPCFGIHPWQAHRFAHDLTALEPLIDASPLLGEIGLDYLWDEDPAHYPAQRAVFAYFLQQASAQNKIVNLHTKAAEHDVVTMLRQHTVRRAIVHWYSGPRDAFDALVAHGCYFTFGVETAHSALIQDFARIIPLDRILTETDGPGGLRWLTGETGMPRHIADVLHCLAELRSVDIAAIQDSVAHNWRSLLAGDQRLAP